VSWLKCVGPSVAIEESCNGMSYALTAQAAVEALYCQCQGEKFYRMSYQQIVDCSGVGGSGNTGCSGGTSVDSFKYIQGSS